MQSEAWQREPEDAPGMHIDRIGVACSGLCAIHCGLMALAPGLIAALGLGALLGSSAEWLFCIFAVLFAAIACISGWTTHRNPIVLALLGLGIILLLSGRWAESMEIPFWGNALSIAAGLILVTGHIIGIRLQRTRV